MVIYLDSGESKGLIPLYSILFRNCWLVCLSRSWTRSAMSSMRKNFGVRECLEFLESSSSSLVSDRLHLELPEECTDSRIRGGDRGVRTFCFAVGEGCDFCHVPICLSSRVCTRVAASFL